jgi:hypothetical protein
MVSSQYWYLRLIYSISYSDLTSIKNIFSG